MILLWIDLAHMHVAAYPDVPVASQQKIRPFLVGQPEGLAHVTVFPSASRQRSESHPYHNAPSGAKSTLRSALPSRCIGSATHSSSPLWRSKNAPVRVIVTTSFGLFDAKLVPCRCRNCPPGTGDVISANLPSCCSKKMPVVARDPERAVVAYKKVLDHPLR